MPNCPPFVNPDCPLFVNPCCKGQGGFLTLVVFFEVVKAKRKRLSVPLSAPSPCCRGELSGLLAGC